MTATVAAPAVTPLPKRAARTYDQFVHAQYEAGWAAELAGGAR